MRAVCVFILIISLLLFFHIPAGADQWEQIGPKGGAVRSVAVHPASPDTVFAGLGGGLYLTVDGGETWNTLPNAPASVYEVVISPANPNVIYLLADFRIHKSTDGGDNWEQITSFMVYSFALDPNDPDHLYGGNSGGTYYTPAGVYSSRDGGVTWSYVEFLDSYTVSALAVDPTDGDIVYAGTAGDFDFPGNGVHKSTDGGENWVQTSTGFPYTNVSCFAIDPGNASTIYAGTSGGGEYGGAGVQKSLDGGGTWATASPGLPYPGWAEIPDIEIDPSNSDIVYTAVGGEIYKSLDAAAHWGLVDTGINNRGVFSIATYPGDTDRLYVGCGLGVLFSSNAGADFTQSGITPIAMTSVVVDYGDSNILYATGHGTFKSTDFGAHWRPKDYGLPTGQVIRQDPAMTQILYQGSYSPSGAVFRTENGGSTWSKTLIDVAIDDISVAASNSATVFAVGLEDPYVGAIWKSENRGLTWSIVSPYHARCVAVDPTNPDVVYAGTDDGPLKTSDGGVTWALSGEGVDWEEAGYLLELVVDPHHPNNVYCGTYNHGVIKSINGGEHWFNSSDGIPDHPIIEKDIRAMAIDPVDPQILYASVRAIGFFVTVDGGQFWRQLSGRRGESNVVIDPNNRDIVYSAGGGVWRYIRTSDCAEPEITSYGPDVVVEDNCGGGCEVNFNASTADDFADIGVVALERRLGTVWVEEDRLLGPMTGPDWTLTSVFDEHFTDGEHVFRVVIREIDGARGVSDTVVVTAARGVPVFFLGVESHCTDGTVTLRWTTRSGADVQGFNIYRSSSREPEYHRINASVISATDEHVFVDTDVRAGETYTYRLSAIDDGGEWFSQTMSATVPAGQLDLLQNHPNPFNASTKISFVVPERAHARLDVYRVDGTYVTSLLDRTVEGGAVSLFWDGRDASGNPVSSGIYFYSLWTDGRTLTKKMVLIK